MWVIVLLVVAGLSALLLRRSIDRETRTNLKFLGKIMAALFAMFLLLGLLLSRR